MVKTVVNLKDFRAPLPEKIVPKGSLTLGIIVRQACCELYNAQQQPFYDAATSFDASTSPSGMVWYDKATVLNQIVEYIQSKEQEIELPLDKVHARVTDWARDNDISRRKLKAQAVTNMIAAAQAAE